MARGRRRGTKGDWFFGPPRVRLWRPRLPVTFLDKKRLAKPANPQGASHKGIPWGGFCRDCPHYGQVQHDNWMRRGYCRLLNLGEWHGPSMGLLSDGLKRCWIREADGPEKVRRPRFAERERAHVRYDGEGVWARGLRQGARHLRLP